MIPNILKDEKTISCVVLKYWTNKNKTRIKNRRRQTMKPENLTSAIEFRIIWTLNVFFFRVRFLFSCLLFLLFHFFLSSSTPHTITLRPNNTERSNVVASDWSTILFVAAAAACLFLSSFFFNFDNVSSVFPIHGSTQRICCVFSSFDLRQSMIVNRARSKFTIDVIKRRI